MKTFKIRFSFLIFIAAFICLFFFALSTSYFAFTIEDEDSWYHFRLLCHRIAQAIRLPSYPAVLRNFLSDHISQLAFGSCVYAGIITAICSNLKLR